MRAVWRSPNTREARIACKCGLRPFRERGGYARGRVRARGSCLGLVGETRTARPAMKTSFFRLGRLLKDGRTKSRRVL